MTAVDLSTGFGFEVITRNALTVLSTSLNAEITKQETIAVGRNFPASSPELVDPLNFHYGIIPSVLQEDSSKFPSVSAFCYSARPRASDLDHARVFDDLLVVEFTVKSQTSESQVNVRATRMIEAIVVTILKNRTLGGHATEIGDAPGGDVGDVFEVTSSGRGHGDTWWWQGGRVEFTVYKYSYL